MRVRCIFSKLEQEIELLRGGESQSFSQNVDVKYSRDKRSAIIEREKEEEKENIPTYLIPSRSNKSANRASRYTRSGIISREMSAIYRRCRRKWVAATSFFFHLFQGCLVRHRKESYADNCLITTSLPSQVNYNAA